MTAHLAQATTYHPDFRQHYYHQEYTKGRLVTWGFALRLRGRVSLSAVISLIIRYMFHPTLRIRNVVTPPSSTPCLLDSELKPCLRYVNVPSSLLYAWERWKLERPVRHPDLHLSALCSSFPVARTPYISWAPAIYNPACAIPQVRTICSLSYKSLD